MPATLTVLALAGAAVVSSVAASTVFQKRAVEFFDPAPGGGSMLIDTLNGLGEPLNVRRIFSISESPRTDIPHASTGYHLGSELTCCTDRRWPAQLRKGDRIVSLTAPNALLHWNTKLIEMMPPIYFSRSCSSEECFGIHLGDPFAANLGDGHGPVNQTMELRQDFGHPDVGTCLESLIGGNHFRVYFQNGPSANSGAAFLA